MRKHLFASSIKTGIAVLAASLCSASVAFAATPTLTLTNNSGSVNVNVTADVNVPVTLYYNNGSTCGSGSPVQLGNTDGNGSLLATIGASAYPISSGSQVCVFANGQYSAMQTWPVSDATGVNTGSLVFNPTAPSVAVGQTVNVSITGGTGFYVSNNSASGIASAAMNGTGVAVAGLAVGSTVVTVCSTSNGCNSFTATVTAGSGSNTTAGSLTFDQGNPMLAIGQTVNVTVSGGSNYYISNNSNPSVVSATLSGNIVSILGGSTGSSAVIICSSSNSCGTIHPTVGSSTASSGSTGGVTFGQNNPNLTVGQTLAISLSGGSGSYFISTATGNAVSPTVNGASLSLLGQSAGTTSVTVCSTTGGCGTLSITVTGAAATTVPTATPTPTPTITGVSNSAVLAQIALLQTQIAQILVQLQTMQAGLAQLAAQVKNTAPSASSAGSASASAAGYQFSNPISLGSSGPDVTALQTILTTKGFYSGSVSGYYGSLTMDAVMKYQTAHGIAPLGNVGPSTRTALNAGQ